MAGEVGGGAAAAVVAEPARAGVRGRDEHAARREQHHPLRAHDRDAAVLERLAQRLERGARELRQLVEEQHAVVGERHLAGQPAAAPPPTRPDGEIVWCGARNGRAATSPPPECSPAIEWMRVTSIASARG